MITRYAIFEGSLPEHQQAAFQDAVLQRLVPAVRRIPGLQTVTVSFSRERDPGAPEIVMFLVTTYSDYAAIRSSLNGPERHRAIKITNEIFDEFITCKIHHYITNTH